MGKADKKKRKIESSSTTTRRTRSATRAIQKEEILSSVLTNGDLVPQIMTFLDVRSLIIFGKCTSQQFHAFLQQEVEQRKKVFATFKTQVHELLEQESISRADALQADELYENAKRLVEDDKGYLSLHLALPGGIDAFDGFSDYPFFEELLQIIGDEYSSPPRTANFYMLPLCFYIRPDGRELYTPSSDDLDLARRRANYIWHKEDHMQGFYESVSRVNDYFFELEVPFDKFDHPLSSFFVEIMMKTASHLCSHKRELDAFRIAAREFALAHPGSRSRDCLHYIIHKADRLD